MVVDLTSTTFCDSSGVHVLVAAHERASARNIGLRLAVSPGGSVRRVLQLTGADHIVAVFASVPEAIQGSRKLPAAGNTPAPALLTAASWV